jgi:tetraacyldisaccharide 4'-kinase
LARANLIILNHIQDDEQFINLKKQLKSYSAAPIVGTKGNVIAIRDLKGQEVAIPSAERKVGMFCAIAHPEYFQRTLEQEGFQVVNEYILADHDTVCDKDLEQFAQTSLKKGAQWLMCTEKDRVKLQDQLSLILPVLWVQLELRVVSGQEEWQSFLQQAEKLITN